MEVVRPRNLDPARVQERGSGREDDADPERDDDTGDWLVGRIARAWGKSLEIRPYCTPSDRDHRLRSLRPDKLAAFAVRPLDEQLADPKSLRNPNDFTPEYAQNGHRSIKPEVFVAVGICTHLGCSPSDKFATGAQPSLPADWKGGFLCPCHGSTFDMAGRVFKNKPAPDNLEVPPHMYLSDSKLLIGEDKKA